MDGWKLVYVIVFGMRTARRLVDTDSCHSSHALGRCLGLVFPSAQAPENIHYNNISSSAAAVRQYVFPPASRPCRPFDVQVATDTRALWKKQPNPKPRKIRR